MANLSTSSLTAGTAVRHMGVDAVITHGYSPNFVNVDGEPVVCVRFPGSVEYAARVSELRPARRPSVVTRFNGWLWSAVREDGGRVGVSFVCEGDAIADLLREEAA